jgi:S-adenosylmethionine:tRNA ribosyltransferase-isomerase
MKTQDFYFNLPPELIAQYPLKNRSESRLLAYQRQTNNCQHHLFKDLVDLLEEGDLLVMNDTKVIPARLYGYKSTGGKVELLIERVISANEVLAHIKASKAPKPGTMIELDENWSIEVTGRDEGIFFCKVHGDVDEMLHQIGHIPLPPYITRSDELSDLTRYQTVYAQHNGSVAAPTAGLHFDESLLSRLQEKGIQIGYVTLHVGAGTFQPVRCEDIKDHKMHTERFKISEAVCTMVKKTKLAGKKVIAVGTTALRSLESAAQNGELAPGQDETNIYITPGYSFKICDGLITNFHLPESTLLMLVSAFIGHSSAMELYRLAIQERYRFFSYGDASLLL